MSGEERITAMMAMATAVLRHLERMSQPPRDTEIVELCRLTGRLEYHASRSFDLAHASP